MKKFCVYKILNLQNNKFYIGATSVWKTRWRTHLTIAKSGKDKFPKHFQAIHAAISKYGEKSFRFEILEWFDNEDDCYLRERELISLYKNENPRILYNMSGGGKGTGSGKNHPMHGKKLPKEWAEKVRLASIRSGNNPDTKQKHRENILKRGWVGENHPMFGKNHTEETRKKISEKGKGRKVGEKTRKLMSEKLKGRKMSDEAIINMKKAKSKIDSRGEKNPNYGNKWNEEQKRNASEKRKGVPCASRKLNQKDINKILDLRKLGYSASRIANCVNKVCISSIKNILSGKQYVDFIKVYKEKTKP